MAITPTFPGVYVQEIPSGARTVVGVATSTAAFVDYFAKGPMNKAVRVQNLGDFTREFGGLDALSEASYGIQQFFLNGGTDAWVVRVASADEQGDNGPEPATAMIGSATTTTQPTNAAAAAVLVVRAVSDGSWGGSIGVRVDPSGSRFALVVTEYAVAATRTGAVRQETFRDLSTAATDRRFAVRVINDDVTGSKLVRVATRPGGSQPLANGTIGGLVTGPLSVPNGAAVNLDIGGATATATLRFPAHGTPQPLRLIAASLQAAVRAAAPADPAFADAAVDVIDQSQDGSAGRLRIVAGLGSNPAALVRLSAVAGDPTATDLRLTTGATHGRVLRSAAHPAAGPTIAANGGLAITVGAAPATTVNLTLAAGQHPLSAIVSDLETLRGARSRTWVADQQ
ncbi:MAG: hypothetical protein AB7V44_34875 [Pseudonocardia sp.]